MSEDNGVLLQTITATGPARQLWRDTTFIRLSLGLFKSFTSETDKDLPQNRTSTPTYNSIKEPSWPAGLSPVLVRTVTA